MMLGYVYITTNLVNGRRYVGKRTSSTLEDDYLGSGTLLKRAIRKHGKQNFRRDIVYIAETSEELNTAEIKLIKQFNAVLDDNYYNLAEGGAGGNTWAHLTREERSAKMHLIPSSLIETQIRQKREKLRRSNKGPKSEDTKQKISITKTGVKRNWSEETKKSYSSKRKEEVAAGINVPPKGNAGNKDFRHTEETKLRQSEIHKELRRKAIEERGSWVSPEGRAAQIEKLKAYYTPEMKAEHLAKIMAGREKARLKREKQVDSA